MAEREKVLKAMECIAGRSNGSVVEAQCRECPYCDSTFESGCDAWAMIVDALALLNEHEARVLSENEVRERLGTYVFVEMFSPQSGRPLCIIYGRVYEDPLYQHFVTVRVDAGLTWNKRWVDYGSGCWEGIRSGWRCWTSHPSDEQRKEVKWE